MEEQQGCAGGIQEQVCVIQEQFEDRRVGIRSMLFFVATISTMDARYHKAVRNALFVAMMLVVMTQSATHVKAVTYPGDIEALKEVSIRVSITLRLSSSFTWLVTPF